MWSGRKWHRDDRGNITGAIKLPAGVQLDLPVHWNMNTLLIKDLIVRQ